MKTKNLILVLAGILVTVALLVLDQLSAAGAGAIWAIGGMYSSDANMYRRLLSEQLGRLAWTELPMWGQFMGFVGNENGKYPKSVAFGSKRGLKPTGKPIEILADFNTQGSTEMDIPLISPLTDLPVYGDKVLLGSEESLKIYYKKVTINQVRKGIKVVDGAVSQQTLKKPAFVKQLIKDAYLELKDYFQRWNAFQPYMAFTRRYSDNLTASAVNGGLAKTAQSHPNFYVMGHGKVTWSAVAATYETNVATALGSLGDAASDYFSTKTIELMVKEASNKKIQPVDMNGKKLYPIVIHPDQAFQLLQDQKWLDAHYYAGVRDKDNALFSGELMGIYRGAIIYVDQNIPGVKISGDTDYSSTYGTVNYHNPNPIANPIDEANKKLAILFGKSAVACGMADPLRFEKEDYDYGNQKTEAGIQFLGFERADIYDTDGYSGTANAFKENSSSLICATYSPTTSNWS